MSTYGFFFLVPTWAHMWVYSVSFPICTNPFALNLQPRFTDLQSFWDCCQTASCLWWRPRSKATNGVAASWWREPCFALRWQGWIWQLTHPLYPSTSWSKLLRSITNMTWNHAYKSCKLGKSWEEKQFGLKTADSNAIINFVFFVPFHFPIPFRRPNNCCKLVMVVQVFLDKNDLWWIKNKTLVLVFVFSMFPNFWHPTYHHMWALNPIIHGQTSVHIYFLGLAFLGFSLGHWLSEAEAGSGGYRDRWHTTRWNL